MIEVKDINKSYYFYGLLFVALLAHLGLGSHFLPPTLAVLLSFMAIRTFLLYGWFNIGALFGLIIVMRYVTVPVFVKLVLGQPFDLYLIYPLQTSLVILVGILSYYAGFFFIEHTFKFRPILHDKIEGERMLKMSLVSYALGFFANITAATVDLRYDEVVSYSHQFASMLHLALILSISAYFRCASRRIFILIWIGFIFLSEVIFTFALNVRTPVVEALIAIFLCFMIDKNISVKKFMVWGVICGLILLFLTPVILNIREYKENLSISEKISSSVDLMLDWNATQSKFSESAALEVISGNYFMDYYGFPANILERFSHINHVDVLVDGAERYGFVGDKLIEQAFGRIVPQVIAPDKPLNYSEGDWLFCEYGLKCLYGNYLTASLIGVSYAAWGWFGVFLTPFLMFATLLLLLKSLYGLNVKKSIFLVYFVVILNNQIVEGGIASYVALIFRQIPQTIFSIYLVYLFSSISIFSSKNKSARHHVTRSIESRPTVG